MHGPSSLVVPNRLQRTRSDVQWLGILRLDTSFGEVHLRCAMHTFPHDLANDLSNDLANDPSNVHANGQPHAITNGRFV